jgi:hypothetical protein
VFPSSAGGAQESFDHFAVSDLQHYFVEAVSLAQKPQPVRFQELQRQEVRIRLARFRQFRPGGQPSWFRPVENGVSG